MASPVGPQTAFHPTDAGTSALASQSWRRYLKDILWATRLTVSVVILLVGRTWPSFRHQLACLIVLTVWFGRCGPSAGARFTTSL